MKRFLIAKAQLFIWVFRKLHPIFDLFLGRLYFWIRPANKTEKKFTISICACFKNEAAYLKEWIEYHRIVGVEHFYLYNNESSDDYMRVLGPYLSEGLVTLVDFPGKGIQHKVYAHCIKSHHADNEWLAMIDLDEFICQLHDVGIDPELPRLGDYLKRYRKYPAIKIWWKQFGSGGNINKDDDALVIERYVSCEPNDVKYNWPKCMLNMDFWDVIDPAGIHNFNTHIKFLGYTLKIPAFNEIWFSERLSKTFRGLQVNHYALKSYDEFIKRKMTNGRADHVVLEGEVYLSRKTFYWIDFRCTERDYSILRRLAELKIKMKQ